MLDPERAAATPEGGGEQSIRRAGGIGIQSSNWVSWFVPGGIAHVPTDSPRGQQIVADLSAAGWETGTVRRDATCPAPRAGFPNLVCGKKFKARKGQDYCSPTCAKRARRHDRQMAACPSDSPFWTPRPDGDISRDIRSDLPGAPRTVSDVTVPLFEVTS